MERQQPKGNVLTQKIATSETNRYRVQSTAIKRQKTVTKVIPKSSTTVDKRTDYVVKNAETQKVKSTPVPVPVKPILKKTKKIVKTKKKQSLEKDIEAALTRFSCPICIDIFPVNSTSATICGHMFCTKCIKEVMESHCRCPMCNKPIVASDVFKLFV